MSATHPDMIALGEQDRHVVQILGLAWEYMAERPQQYPGEIVTVVAIAADAIAQRALDNGTSAAAKQARATAQCLAELANAMADSAELEVISRLHAEADILAHARPIEESAA